MLGDGGLRQCRLRSCASLLTCLLCSRPVCAACGFIRRVYPLGSNKHKHMVMQHLMLAMVPAMRTRSASTAPAWVHLPQCPQTRPWANGATTSGCPSFQWRHLSAKTAGCVSSPHPLALTVEPLASPRLPLPQLQPYYPLPRLPSLCLPRLLTCMLCDAADLPFTLACAVFLAPACSMERGGAAA